MELRLSGFESRLWNLDRITELSSVLVYSSIDTNSTYTAISLSTLEGITSLPSGIYCSDKKSVEIPWQIMYLFFYHGFQDCPFILSVLKFHYNVCVCGICFLSFPASYPICMRTCFFNSEKLSAHVKKCFFSVLPLILLFWNAYQIFLGISQSYLPVSLVLINFLIVSLYCILTQFLTMYYFSMHRFIFDYVMSRI